MANSFASDCEPNPARFPSPLRISVGMPSPRPVATAPTAGESEDGASMTTVSVGPRRPCTFTRTLTDFPPVT